MKKNNRIAILGAGISGLTTAWWLNRAGKDITVFESSGHTGGSIITEKKDGYLLDLGPNSALETSDLLRKLIRDLGIEDQKVYGNEASNNRYVVRKGKLHALPMSPLKFLKTKLFSASAKLRLLREPFVKPTDGKDISLADFVRHRLGEEFLDYAINPFVAGVYAGDPEKLSAPAAFPKLFALEQNYGSFIKGTIKGARERKKRGEISKDRAKLFSFMDGMQAFTDALARPIASKIKHNTTVDFIEQSGEHFVVHSIRDGKKSGEKFDGVVVSLPAAAMARVLRKLSPQNAREIEKIQYPPVAVVIMAFRESDIKRELDGFGFLVPKVEKKQILGSIWSSTIFPKRAPEGYALFTTFVGGARQPENANLDDSLLRQIVFNDLNDLVGLLEDPVFVKIKRWPKAIPQYGMGYQWYQKMFTELEDQIPGLYFSGNFRQGIGIGDSVLSANATVTKINEA